ncbi:mitogen-activated protein kinase kinase kinase 7-like isoform X2 [Lingula anatina]|uniref:Mitogen-activated protein kinase kinase kinase 7 n=1 Tax=Lingula anatina TaxID=7574 RepID=A0A1S3IGW7_LINAN|nr:mitogen-activated protein kinase kinase kinase 7-like isoform X2 [Lingula anatina]|eukprot:XP_013397106.1 mitogen-activated protein kinase kinase kinase 7-like isoform X2 [Lingula anatina]
MDSPGSFAEEIDFNELQFEEVVGRGAFGVVSRAIWRGINVAVKLIETEAEKKAFMQELKSLSRVNHPNIVKLYGACSRAPVCLVMEYAEGGSLYNALHGSGPQVQYKAAHAMSWSLQCAKGVEYLHNIKPKSIIHRDLKPPNLLLVNGGTVLKICDFGTACDIQTHMTNNKGSAAWMAPEVFEGCNYSEKCDVFSFGIILWEVITRQKPFDDIGGPAFRIMWAVHNGTRPPLIKNCPRPLELLMTKCWAANPVERPSMSEVARIMEHLAQFFPGGDEPLTYPDLDDSGGNDTNQSSVYDTPPPTNTMHTMTTHELRHTIKEALSRQNAIQGEPVPVLTPTTPRATPTVVEDNDPDRGTSAPASLAASRENLDKSSRSSTPSVEFKRYSADLSKLDKKDIIAAGAPGAGASTGKVHGHRRSGSYGNTPLETTPTSSLNVPSSHSNFHHVPSAPAQLYSGQNLEVPQAQNGTAQRSVSWAPGETAADSTPRRTTRFLSDSQPSSSHSVEPSTVGYNSQTNQGVNHGEYLAATLAYALEPHLQPLPPCPSSQESMSIYQAHCQLAHEYLKVQTEIALLLQRKEELKKELHKEADNEQMSNKFENEWRQLSSENESLVILHENLKKQSEMIRQQQHQRMQAQSRN